MIKSSIACPAALTGRELLDRRAENSAEDGEALAAYLEAAGRECQGFTAGELESGAVSLMIDIFPMTTEWLARCRAALGDHAFLACCPDDPETLTDYRASLDVVLPIYEARHTRSEPPLGNWPEPTEN